jgi:alpha-acetolactate decarboxylase
VCEARSEIRPAGRSLCFEQPSARGQIVPAGPDILVQRVRPIVADLVRPGRIGLGTLLAPADPMVIVDGLCYRLDPSMAVSVVSPLERVHCATVVDFRDGRRSRIEQPVPGADVALLATQAFDASPGIVAVQLSGTFSSVTVPNGTFGRNDGIAVGFVTSTSAQPDWHLSFVTADRTFGGPIHEVSVENVELTVAVPRVVYWATAAGRTRSSPPPNSARAAS